MKAEVCGWVISSLKEKKAERVGFELFLDTCLGLVSHHVLGGKPSMSLPKLPILGELRKELK